MAAEGLSIDWYVHRHRSEDELLPWGARLGGPSRRLPLAGLAGGAGRVGTRGLPVDAVLRLRRVHRVRPGARRRVAGDAGRREPGNRPGPHVGGAVPVEAAPVGASGGAGVRRGSGCASRSWGRSAGRATATWPACGSGRCAGPRCRWRRPRASRPGPSSPSGWRCRPAHESLGEYLDAELVGRVERRGGPLAELLSPELPVGIGVRAPRIDLDGAPSLQQDVTACTWEIELAGVERLQSALRSAAAMAAGEIVVTRTRKGHAVTDDIRPAIRISSVGRHRRRCRCRRGARHAATGVASGRARRCMSSARVEARRVVRPINGSSATARGGSPSRPTRRRLPHARGGRAA